MHIFRGWAMRFCLPITALGIAFVVTFPTTADREMRHIDKALLFGAISGVVIDAASGVPLPCARLTLWQNGQEIQNTLVPMDASGTFIVPALQPGIYQFVAEAPGFQDTITLEVDVMAGQVTQLRILLDIGAFTVDPDSKIFGVVEDSATGLPLHGVQVLVETEQDAFEETPCIGGGYEILAESLPLGTEATVTFSASGYLTKAEQVNLEGGEQIEINTQLEKLDVSGTIGGQILAQSTGDGIGGASLVATDILTRVGVTTSCYPSGEFNIPFMSLGTYELRASAPMFKLGEGIATLTSQLPEARNILYLAAEGEGEGEGENEGEEQCLSLTEIANNLLSTFVASDRNGDGYVSFDEASEDLQCLTQAEYVQLDANADGHLTRAELRSAAGLPPPPNSGCPL